MGDFFEGWRRKIGLLTLLMALLFMGSWVSSRSAKYFVNIGNHYIDNWPNGVLWAQHESNAAAGWSYSWNYRLASASELSAPIENFTLVDLEDFPWKIEWEFDRLGFILGTIRPAMFPTQTRGVEVQACETELIANEIPPFEPRWITYVLMPHWAFVIPLTLISAFLLLTKPRTSVSAAPTRRSGTSSYHRDRATADAIRETESDQHRSAHP